jgi:hypothetical protein
MVSGRILGAAAAFGRSTTVSVVMICLLRIR